MSFMRIKIVQGWIITFIKRYLKALSLDLKLKYKQYRDTNSTLTTFFVIVLMW